MTLDHKRHVRLYIGIFAALAVLTVVTVGVSTLPLAAAAGIAAALLIAIVKGSLVASFFMHLAWEKKIIFALLVFTLLFFLILLFLPLLTNQGNVVSQDVS